MYAHTYVCIYVCIYILHVCIVCMNERMHVGVCRGGAGTDPGLPGPKTYAILGAILRKKIQN